MGDLSVSQVSALIQDDLFSDVEHVGVTGGEPTLRPDLPEVFTSLILGLPKLKGLSFITNGFNPGRALDVLVAANKICKEFSVGFNGMVSLDGPREIHDRIRGKTGSYDRAIETLQGLKQNEIDVSGACTVVKANIFYLENFLDWTIDNEYYFRFRVAEYIDRLYVTDATHKLRNFSWPERAALISFFTRLRNNYEVSHRVRATYDSILSIITGGNRIVTCPYQKGEAINVGSSGDIRVCAPAGRAVSLVPKSEIESHLEKERIRIEKSRCSKCIHDYHDDYESQEKIRRLARKQLMFMSFQGGLKNLKKLSDNSFVIFMGWYGTETAGDKAILFQTIEDYINKYGKNTIPILVSLNPIYSTLMSEEYHQIFGRELTIAPPFCSELLDLNCVNELVMAGGPLMEVPDLEVILAHFTEFRRRGVVTTLYGVGLSNYISLGTVNKVKELFAQSSNISFRDRASQKYAKKLLPKLKSIVIDDPALTFARKFCSTRTREKKVVCFLRMPTKEYPYLGNSGEIENSLIQYLRTLIENLPGREMRLLHMHFHHTGGNDIRLNSEICRHLNNENVTLERRPMSLMDVLNEIRSAELAVCMRYHSMVFSFALQTPFIAIDYTSGGKVKAFFNENVKANGSLIGLSDLLRVKHDYAS